MTAIPDVDYARVSMLYRSLHKNDNFRVQVPDACLGLVNQEDTNLQKSLLCSTTQVIKRMEAYGTRPPTTSRHFHGYMSTGVTDRLRENLVQEGMCFDEYMRFGWFNDNHIQMAGAILGYPTVAELHRHPIHGLRWYTQGYLLEGEGLSRVDEVYNILRALENVETRKMGLSVEGKIIQRTGATVTKTKIRNTAITPYAVNSGCPMELLLDAMQGTDDYMRALTADNPITSIGGGAVLSTSNEKGEKREIYTCAATGVVF